MMCDRIDLAHEQDLLCLFDVVVLVDADSICQIYMILSVSLLCLKAQSKLLVICKPDLSTRMDVVSLGLPQAYESAVYGVTISSCICFRVFWTNLH
jgi:hypothetical protein